MSSSGHTRVPNLPVSGRPSLYSPSSYSSEIPVSRSSKVDTTRIASQHRGSLSAETPRDSPSVHSKPFLSAPNDAPNTEDDGNAPQICDNCDLQTSPIWNCAYCGMNYCDPCWGMQGPHKRGRVGPDGLPHEKADPTIVRRFKDILTPPKEHREQQELHIEDKDTTWFGLARDSQNKPIFQDYGRYSAIMGDSNTGEYQLRYPQLVSFIGQTGAGKSTLIKMLIDQQERIHGSSKWGFPSPVVGSTTNANVPTSGDVHLYSDPSTYISDYPMLLADCEGLEGGENTPVSTMYHEKALAASEEKGKEKDIHRERGRLQKISKGLHCTRREVKWANSPEKAKRQYAVTELYPRLLYTFSDVIVFVLRNPKTFESTVLSLLITWARSSIEKSLNQPTLPHAVIVLNATDTKIDQQAWDPGFATESLMSDVAGAINRDPTYKELTEYWITKGKKISTMKDLLECYYSSITVVRVPGEGRYMMINSQVQKLHDTLSKRCKESFNAKRRSRMLSNSETLNVYLQSAFDHFASDLDTPFNFMDISFKINPIPLDFGGNILKLAVAMKVQHDDPKKIFEELSFMVASCILLDCVRQNFKGQPDQILEQQYLYHCDTALEDFCAIYWPCTYHNKRNERCVNVKERHTKGHQNEKGNIIGSGPYESHFTFDDFAEDWSRCLQNHLSKFQSNINSPPLMQAPDELRVTTELHHSNVKGFYKSLGGAQKFVSHLTCYCCLRELAEHPLPCGHVLCTPCVRSYGKPHTDLSGSYTMASCPLHDKDTVFPVYWPIYFKPPLAGVRILSLDGGGIRGVAILQVLLEVEKELKCDIPIQDFFDLIVGTSTGGIIALGLGIKDLSVKDCDRLFHDLVDKAFTPRYPGRIRFSKSKYRTKPLEEALKDCFRDEAMFGGVSERLTGSARKVAVTAATETGEQAVIFTNYNRPDDSQVGYRLVRQDNPDSDLNIREAARATSAAPTFFKPFVNPRTKEAFLDGAVFHNNPVRIANYESKLLWPDAEERHPDILLSIGTARHDSDTETSHLTGLDRKREQVRKMFGMAKPVVRKKRSAVLKAFPEVDSWIKIFKKRMESVLDAEMTWKEFRNDVVGTSSPIAAARYVRVNPQTKTPVPKMDEKMKIHVLETEVRHGLLATEMKLMVEKIAHSLVASSFYFEKTGPIRESDDTFTMQGTIACRFAAGSDNLSKLGTHIQNKSRRNFVPFLRVQEIGHDENTQVIELSRKILDDMILRRFFNLDPIIVPVTSEMALLSINLHMTNNGMKPSLCVGFPISGFPRSLADVEPLKRTTSPPQSQPERPKISIKRQTLRNRQRIRQDRITLERRPASDGDITYGRRNAFSATSNEDQGLAELFDEASDDKLNDVSDWARRHNEAVRLPPKAPSIFVGHGSIGSLQQLNEAETKFIDASEPVPPYEEVESPTLIGRFSGSAAESDKLRHI